MIVVAEILLIGSVDFEIFQPTLMGILTNRRSWIVGARRNWFKDEMGSNKLQQEKVEQFHCVPSLLVDQQN
jgi:hypothetical protein